MGAVWHATHLGLDIPCAIKFVKGELADQDDIKARFEREAKAAAHLRSPHVVQILDHGVCEGTPYIAMELLDGEDLGVRLQKRGRLAPEELHKIMSEACRALAKAHAQGIVHRDLKPDNIFLVRDDDREITKVLDFGIAKTVTNELGGSGTKTGAMLGTPYYMSPEQAQGTKTVDFRSDLWSLAVIAYQALTGSLPFESEALGDLLVKIIISPIPTPSQVAPVPAGFDKWWAKAASRDPADRFQSAKEFSDALALVCGVSHVSGVIDRSQLRIVAEKAGQTVPMDAVQSPPPKTPSATPRGDRASSPHQAPPLPPPRASAAPPLPPPRASAAPPLPIAGPPAPGPAANLGTVPLDPQQAFGAGPNAATPTPLSRSFAIEEPAPKPASRAGLAVVLALGGLLFVATLGIVGWKISAHMSSSQASPSPSASASAATADTASAPAASTTPPPPSAASAPPAAQALPPPAAQAADTTQPSDNGASPTSGTTPVSAANGGGGGGSGSSSSSHRPKPTSGGSTPTKPKPGKPADMGF
jgi:serine/threonine protein kinase